MTRLIFAVAAWTATLAGCAPLVQVDFPWHEEDSTFCDSTRVDANVQARLRRSGNPDEVRFSWEPLGCIEPSRLEEDGPLFASLLFDELDANVEWFAVEKIRTEHRGLAHIRMQQMIGDHPVVGARVVLHVDPHSGLVRGINSRFRAAAGALTLPAIGAQEATGMALAACENGSQSAGLPLLTYVIGDDDSVHLAWSQEIFRGAEGDLTRLFISGADGSVVATHPLSHSILNRLVWDAQGTDSIQGVPDIVEGGQSTDAVLQGTYDNIGLAYDYFDDRFGRDGIDGAGGAIAAVVDFMFTDNSGDATPNNARFAAEALNMADGSTLDVLLFGDGDGVVFGPLGLAVDVVAHEMTHGIDHHENQLVYAHESGALDEAFADIFGTAAQARATGVVDWEIGEDAFTPGLAGDAMRYMMNPVRDGRSRDFYADRIVVTDAPFGDNDFGGVHSNSGIANLSFYLLSEGGTHPADKSTVDVPSVGFERAERIYYRAHTEYLQSDSRFEDARAATARAAFELYGWDEFRAVHDAWDAVGVPGERDFPTAHATMTLMMTLLD